jgi:hypothetical protein
MFLGNEVSRKIAFEIYWPLEWTNSNMDYPAQPYIVRSLKKAGDFLHSASRA